MPTYERLDYGNDDGSQWGGGPTDRIAFYGGTPSIQLTMANVSAASQTSTIVSTLVARFATLGLFSTVTYTAL